MDDAGLGDTNRGYANEVTGMEFRVRFRPFLVNPDFAGGWSELGDAYAHTDQMTKAIEAYRQVVRINPNYVGGWYLLSYSYERAGQPAQAI